MSKKNLLISVVFLIIIFIAAGYLILRSKPLEPVNINSLDNGGNLNVSEKIKSNPLEDKPNLNPVDASNPFRSIKTNPFK